MKWLSFIATGWTPLLFGVYLTCKEEYLVAIGCFLISFCGFRQVCEFLKLYEVLQMKTNTVDEKKLYKVLVRKLKKQSLIIKRGTLVSSAAIRELIVANEMLEKKLNRQQAELYRVSKSLEQKDKEICRLRGYYD
jgi:hypothetical protein